MAENGKGRTAAYIGVGCVTSVAGFFSGAMFAVLLAKVVGMVRRCEPLEHGAPCDWHIYAFVGGIVGAVSLPWLAIRRLRQSAAAETTERG